MTDHPNQLDAVEFTEADQARLVGFSCGDDPWSKHVGEWIRGSDVLDSMKKRGTCVWLFETAQGEVVGLGRGPGSVKVQWRTGRRPADPGTTKKQVGQLFRDVERAALRPLPALRFPCCEEGLRKVPRDGYIEVARAYYSAPPEYTGEDVWVRWNQQTVRICANAGAWLDSWTPKVASIASRASSTGRN